MKQWEKRPCFLPMFERRCMFAQAWAAEDISAAVTEVIFADDYFSPDACLSVPDTLLSC
jgi:hypothetical protein